MNLLSALLFAAALPAGWAGAVWWRGPANPDTAAPLTSFPSTAAAPANDGSASSLLHPPAPGSAARAGLICSLAALPQSALTATREQIAHWPPGTARDLALALLDARLAAADADAPVFDFLEPRPDNAVPEDHRLRVLAAAMLQGSMDTPDGDARDVLRDWVTLDPAAASAAILKMPAGAERTEAVNDAAKIMARTDAAAAMKFVRASGENHFTEGTARAWLALTRQTTRLAGAARTPESGADLARGLNPAQQESLMLALTELVSGGQGTPGSYDMMADNELFSLILELPHLSPGPAKQQLLKEIAFRNEEALYPFVSIDPNPEIPEQAAVVARRLERRFQDDPQAALEDFKNLGTNDGPPGHTTAALNVAAPALLSQMAVAGHATEAATLLPRITDPNARRKALEAILPAWMDTDPAAARAAFNAAPLTALEREKWERHPAFLLRPEARD